MGFPPRVTARVEGASVGVSGVHPARETVSRAPCAKRKSPANSSAPGFSFGGKSRRIFGKSRRMKTRDTIENP